MTLLATRRIGIDFTTVWTASDGLGAVAIGVDCGPRTELDMTVTKVQTSAATLAGADHRLEAALGSPAAAPDGVELLGGHGPQTTRHAADVLARFFWAGRCGPSVRMPTVIWGSFQRAYSANPGAMLFDHWRTDFYAACCLRELL